MSPNKRTFEHRRIVARQGDSQQGDSATSTSTTGGQSTSTSSSTTTSSTSPGNGGNGGGGFPHHTSSTTSTTSSAKTTSTTDSETSKDTNTSSTQSTVSSTTSSSSSSASATNLSHSTTKTSSTNVVNFTLLPTDGTNGGSYTYTSSSVDPGATSGSSSSASTSGSVNTGAMVGGIAGGLIVCAILGFLISFYIRRWRKRAREDEFDAAQFRRSAMVMDGDSRPNSFFGGWTNRPMSIFSRTFRPLSVGSATGAGMAGHGAYKYQQDASGYYQEKDADVNQQSQAIEGQRGLQPRQQYTFGQPIVATAVNAADTDNGYGDHLSDSHGGAYSSQPQAQDLYNLQAYGDYQAYALQNESHGDAITTQQYAHTGATHNEDAYGGM